MFSQSAEYALRAVVWLAENANDGPIGNQKIAEGTQVPVTYLAKILQELAKAGLVTSRRGVGGGFTLNYDPQDISVLDVLNAVDPIKRINSCPLHLKTHAKKRCGMHASLDNAMAIVEDVLSKSTIEEIINDRSRPRPMSDLQEGLG